MKAFKANRLPVLVVIFWCVAHTLGLAQEPDYERIRALRIMGYSMLPEYRSFFSKRIQEINEGVDDSKIITSEEAKKIVWGIATEFRKKKKMVRAPDGTMSHLEAGSGAEQLPPTFPGP